MPVCGKWKELWEDRRSNHIKVLRLVHIVITAAYCCLAVLTMADILLATEPGGLGRSVSSEPDSLQQSADQPITRSEFAELLVKTKQITSDHWKPVRPQGRYKDLSPGSSEELTAEILYRHRIRAANWTPPPNANSSYDLFHPDAPVTRADAAFAVYLAHRPALMNQ